MAVKFDFLSPGVLLREFDKSQIPAIKTADGLCIIGTAPQGPGNIPVKVRDFETFETLYGAPSPGRGQAGDSDGYRSSSFTDVSYGMYAAQAWLKSTDSPVTFIRLIGEQHPSQSAGTGLQAGWKTTNTTPSASLDSCGGAYGLFMFPSASNSTSITGTLAAIFYANEGALRLSGTLHAGGAASASCGDVYVSDPNGHFGAFKLEHVDSAETSSYSFSFNEAEDNFVRKAFNTDPQKTNSSVTNPAVVQKADEHMWLGESYAEAVNRIVSDVSSSAGKQTAVLLYMGGNSGGNFIYGNMNREASYAKSGWFFSQDPNGKAGGSGYSTTGSTEKLFRICSIYKGSECQNRYKIQIAVRQLNDGNGDEYSRFDLALTSLSDGSIVEQFVGLNLNPASDDFIAKRIGNQELTWNDSEKKYKINGQYPNLSSHIRVELSNAVEKGSLINKGACPWGVHGPIGIADAFYGKNSPDKDLQLVKACDTDHPLKSMFLGDADEVVFGSGAPTGVQSTLDITVTTAAFDASHSFNIAVPSAIGGEPGNAVKIMFGNGAGSGAADQIRIRRDANTETPTATDLAQLLVFAINGTTPSGPQAGGSGTYAAADVGFADVGTNGTAGVAGITASRVGAVVTITADQAHADGDSITLTDVIADPINTLFGSASKALAGGVTPGTDNKVINGLTDGSTDVCIKFPSLRLTTEDSTEAGGNYSAGDALGVRHIKGAGSTRHASYIDLVRAGPSTNKGAQALSVYPSGESDPDPTASGLDYTYSFTLDDVIFNKDAQDKLFYEAGSRATGNSITHKSGSAFLVDNIDGAVFSSPLFGGFDGVDITEPNPFSNRYLGGNGGSNKAVSNNYAVYAFEKALDTVADPEVAAMDLLSYPGLTKPTLTKQILTLAASRGDCLAIIDPEGGLSPAGEDAVTETAGSISTTVTKLRGRRLNNSYGCAYYPWVRVDTPQATGIYMPPSVAAIGAMAGSDRQSDVWFAPAGFNRGGLNPLGSLESGLSVVGTEEHLTKKNRDSLYSNNINPIARFPATNDIVVFGQKTLQQTRSALDRINVRRMMIYLKKQIGAIADQFLFERNSQEVWLSFSSQANRVLDALRADGGISEYSLILDETTTTPDLVDRNILYAKVFVKPARAIEFIVVDFVITRSGVDFGSVSY